MANVYSRVPLSKEILRNCDEQAESSKMKVSQWLLRQRSLKFISVPSKKPITKSVHPNDSSPCVDSGLSVTSVHTPPAVCRMLHFDTTENNSTGAESNLKRTRSVQSNSCKRRRYRVNKKRKYFEKIRQTSVSDSAGNPCPNTPSEEGSNDSSSLCASHWRVYMDQAEHFRQVQARKQAELDDKYGTFVDRAPTFPADSRKITLPDSLKGIDRVEVSFQLKEMLKKENEALFNARFFRDRCETLEQTVRQLQTEKEAVRYFWRNKVLEGNSRAGRIFKAAISPK